MSCSSWRCEKSSQRKAIKVGINTCTVGYSTGLTGFAGMVGFPRISPAQVWVSKSPQHIHRDFLLIIILIQQMSNAFVPLSEILTWGHFSLGVPPWDHLLKWSLDHFQEGRLEGSPMKDLVCLWDRSALTRNILSCLVSGSEIWAALHGQYFKRNVRQFSLGWWAQFLLQYSENTPWFSALYRLVK